MATIQYNRRNFLSSFAILSAGTTFGSTLKHFYPAGTANGLQKTWASFWKKAGGEISYSTADAGNNQQETKGHHYKYGEVIYFPKENILAQPTWIFWNDRTNPADVVVTFFENNHSFNKILRLNRYELDALYLLSKQPHVEQLLLTSFNNTKPIAGASTAIIKTKTNINKNSQIQEVSYYRGQSLIFKDKIIHHT